MTASQLGSFGSLPEDEPYPGVHRVAFSSEEATVTQYTFDPGARFPLHQHPQEQITLIQEGDVEFTVAGRPTTMTAGDWSVVAPDVEHGLLAGPGGARILAMIVPRRQSADAYTVKEQA